ncbi:hypothetical protein B0H66DRAFT_204818 [Apodospora peruviana]|uniref:Zn(2)-C6 fungal-type domain-containing protein n=1 Tax=Apodospora peruviana TaxID=516989 RepID=A0AAE0M7S5_9PEZI|nr:hypothetical protein B0H66DRAFT_204818 [Apodospora peruviana]
MRDVADRKQCDNERPFCRKCIDSGRTCDGYKRETVFIIGTIEDQGRCSSHPPRVVKPSKKSRLSPRKEEQKLELVANEPLKPAWDDLISVSTAGKTYHIQNAALHTNMDYVVKRALSNDSDGDEGGGQKNFFSLSEYQPPNIQPFVSDGDFQLRSQALVHLSPLEETQGEGMQMTTDSICMFLYDHNNSIVFRNQAPWRDLSIQNDNIRRLGPTEFRSFPNHHFFVRVYRHNAICTALLNRTPTFLESHEWKTTPWELHPKTLFDQLFDIIVLLPSVLHRADRIHLAQQQNQPPLLARRLMAQDLLQNCLNIERQFDEWYAAATHATNQHQSDLYWVEELDDIIMTPSTTATTTARSSASPGSTHRPPFADTFAFPDALTAFMCIYSWTALVQLYLCVERLYWAALEPDAEGNMPPMLMNMTAVPGDTTGAGVAMQINLLQYSLKVREMAANICRSLDFALANTVQPDMLAVPLFVVRQFYEHVGINRAAGGGAESVIAEMMGSVSEPEVISDGRLELVWCEGFRERLAQKGREIVEVVQGRRWVDLATY